MSDPAPRRARRSAMPRDLRPIPLPDDAADRVEFISFTVPPPGEAPAPDPVTAPIGPPPGPGAGPGRVRVPLLGVAVRIEGWLPVAFLAVLFVVVFAIGRLIAR